jgi:hypothetical protein
MFRHAPPGAPARATLGTPGTERYRSGRNGGASKASCRVSGTWVRIPPSPPIPRLRSSLSVRVVPRHAAARLRRAASGHESHPLRQTKSFTFNRLTGVVGSVRAMACDANRFFASRSVSEVTSSGLFGPRGFFKKNTRTLSPQLGSDVGARRVRYGSRVHGLHADRACSWDRHVISLNQKSAASTCIDVEVRWNPAVLEQPAGPGRRAAPTVQWHDPHELTFERAGGFLFLLESIAGPAIKPCAGPPEGLNVSEAGLRRLSARTSAGLRAPGV